MANRGRDLKVGILSDTDKFDVDKPVKELERLGEEALRAAKDVDTSTDRIDNSLEDLGREAKSTADKVDNAFDAIAKSSRSNLRKVDDDADKAKQGLDEFKDEAGSSGREAAASFSGGFDDITDLIQETAANAFAGFGPLGAAAGIAAAAGIGFIVNKINEAKERVADLTESFVDLRRDGIDPAKEATTALTDEMDSMDLVRFKEDADRLGISYDTMRAALNGNAEAIKLVREATRRYNDEQMAGQDLGQGYVDHFSDLNGRLDETEQGLKNSADAAKLAGKAFEYTAPEIASVRDGLKEIANAEFDGAMDSIATSIRDVADASDEVAEAVAEKGQVSLTTLTNLLKEQTEAAKTHRTNVEKALREGGSEFAQWVAEQGSEVSQAYAEGSAKERKALREAFKKNVGAQMGGGIGEGLDGTKQTITDKAGNIYNVVQDQLTGKTILIPVGIERPSAAQIAAVQRDIRARFGTINIPVGVDAPKYGRGRYIP